MQLFGLGTPELILIVVVLLIFFGKDRLPDLARSIGKSVTELKRGFSEGWKEEEKGKDNQTVTMASDGATGTKQAPKSK
jgi:TatA/E family protein of Tat protein translocase